MLHCLKFASVYTSFICLVLWIAATLCNRKLLMSMSKCSKSYWMVLGCPTRIDIHKYIHIYIYLYVDISATNIHVSTGSLKGQHAILSIPRCVSILSNMRSITSQATDPPQGRSCTGYWTGSCSP